MKKEKSCGMIVFNFISGFPSVLLVKQKNDYWGYPKGHMENNETEQQTAMRELKEETNVDAMCFTTKKLISHYMIDKKTEKEVVYFIGLNLTTDIKKQDSEIEDAKWVHVDEAVDVLTFENDRQHLQDALMHMQDPQFIEEFKTRVSELTDDIEDTKPELNPSADDNVN